MPRARRPFTGFEPGRREEQQVATRRLFVTACTPSGEAAFFVVRLTWGFGLFDTDGQLVLAVRTVTRPRSGWTSWHPAGHR